MSNLIANSSSMEPIASPGVRSFAIGSIGFLTLVELFAAQAILPQLMQLYLVSPTKVGLAVNASTLGMAVAGPLAAVVIRGLSRVTRELGSASRCSRRRQQCSRRRPHCFHLRCCVWRKASLWRARSH